MELQSGQKNRYGWFLLAAAVFLLFVTVFLAGVQSVSAVSEEKEMEQIENAVVRSAVLCYGTEGAYPESLDYLKEHYGLRYDEEKYIVDYEIAGKNLRPQVRVVRLAREGKRLQGTAFL